MVQSNYEHDIILLKSGALHHSRIAISIRKLSCPVASFTYIENFVVACQICIWASFLVEKHGMHHWCCNISWCSSWLQCHSDCFSNLAVWFFCGVAFKGFQHWGIITISFRMCCTWSFQRTASSIPWFKFTWCILGHKTYSTSLSESELINPAKSFFKW